MPDTSPFASQRPPDGMRWVANATSNATANEFVTVDLPLDASWFSLECSVKLANGMVVVCGYSAVLHDRRCTWDYRSWSACMLFRVGCLAWLIGSVRRVS